MNTTPVANRFHIGIFGKLFSRQKGDRAEFVRGVREIDRLRDGDGVLILEACTHHPMPDDIGRSKLPRWIRAYTGREIVFEVNTGPLVNSDMGRYRLVIACGGCMVNRKEMLARIGDARACGVPITKYGSAISFVHGVLDRAFSPFPDVQSLLADVGQDGESAP